MKKIIKLISPKMSLRPMDSEFKRRMSPSVSLLVIAGLTPDDYEVVFEDDNINDFHPDDEPWLVGITVNVDTSAHAYEIASHYRKKGVPVILGGIHPSANPDEALRHADAVCIGEAENVWKKILADRERNTMKGRYYSEEPADLANMPIPRRDLLKEDYYLYTNISVSSRSCPHHCEFCYNSCDYIHHQYRNRPVHNVIEEIRSLNTHHVMFIDDNFIGNPHWTREFVREIKNMNLTWNCAVSADILNHPRLMDDMADSGLKSAFIGFETINPEALRNVSKRQNRVERYGNLVKALHGRGIMINASLAFGFDEDGPEVFKNTLDWLVGHKIETMTAHILTPYPGTKLFKRLQSEKRIFDYNWQHYNTAHVVFQPKKMSPEELYEGYLGMYRNFYSIKNIFKRAPWKKMQWLSYFLFNIGYRKFGKFFSNIAKISGMNRIGKFGRKMAYGIE